MKSFNWKSPNFKKWGLFFGLVLSLGFSLSWNPHYLGYAEYRTYKTELASNEVILDDVTVCDYDESYESCQAKKERARKNAEEAAKAAPVDNAVLSKALEEAEKDARLYDAADAAAAGTGIATSVQSSAPQVKSSTATASKVAASSDAKNKFTTKQIDLPKYADTKQSTFVADSLNILKSDDKHTIIEYKIRKKTEGGAIESCDECGAFQQIRVNTRFATNEPGDLRTLSEFIFEANKSKLIALAEKDKKNKKSEKKDKKKSEKEDKEDKILTSGLHPSCKEMKGKDLIVERMECQKTQIAEAEEACDEDEDKTCRAKIKSMYKPIKTFLSGCTRNITSPRQAERCEGADDLAAELLSITSQKTIVSDILRIGRAKVENLARDYQLAFKSDNMHPAVAATWMSGNGGIIDRASIGLGDSFYNAILDNENITMNEHVGRFFSREFLDPIKTLKRGLYEKPLDYQIGTTMLDGLDRPMPTNIWSIRGGQAPTGTTPVRTNTPATGNTRLMRTQ